MLLHILAGRRCAALVGSSETTHHSDASVCCLKFRDFAESHHFLIADFAHFKV